MVKLCWLDPMREVIVVMNKRVFQRYPQQEKDPEEGVSEVEEATDSCIT